MITAVPLKFCLKYKPPTIAVVYTIASSAKSKSKSTKQRKYIHSIIVDFTDSMAPKGAKLRDEKPQHTVESLEKLC